MTAGFLVRLKLVTELSLVAYIGRSFGIQYDAELIALSLKYQWLIAYAGELIAHESEQRYIDNREGEF